MRSNIDIKIENTKFNRLCYLGSTSIKDICYTVEIIKGW